MSDASGEERSGDASSNLRPLRPEMRLRRNGNVPRKGAGERSGEGAGGNMGSGRERGAEVAVIDSPPCAIRAAADDVHRDRAAVQRDRDGRAVLEVETGSLGRLPVADPDQDVIQGRCLVSGAAIGGVRGQVDPAGRPPKRCLGADRRFVLARVIVGRRRRLGRGASERGARRCSWRQRRTRRRRGRS